MRLRAPAPPRALRLLVRLGLAALFVYAGAAKLADPASFAQEIGNYRVLSDTLGRALAVGLPVLEVVAGLGLLTGTYMRGAAALCGLMLLAFAGAMAQAKLRGINLECGCFGASAKLQVSWAKVTLDLLLAMLAVWIASAAQRVPDTRQASA